SHSLRGTRLNNVSELLDLVTQLIRRCYWHDELDRFPVLRGKRPDDGVTQPECLDVSFQLGCFAKLGRGEGGPVLNDDHRRDLLGVPEPRLPVACFRRFGACREERSLVIGGDLVQPPERWAANAGDAKPDDDKHHRHQPSKPERYLLRVHGSFFRDMGKSLFHHRISLPWNYSNSEPFTDAGFLLGWE